MNKQKMLIGTILSLINIPISFFISIVIHTRLTENYHIDIFSLLSQKQYIAVLILVFILIEVIIFFIATKNRNTFESSVSKITDNIVTPDIMGQGQHGTSRWLTKKEFDKKFKKNTLYLNQNEKNQQFSSGGIVIGYKKDRKKESIYYIDENIHTLTVRCYS